MTDYWFHPPGPPAGGLEAFFRSGAGNRYITFELDAGGLNNIRMQLEYVAAVAAITRRTLVLPPADSWYLVNHGPVSREGDIGGVSRHEEFFDLAALNKWIDVVSTAEFVRREGARLDIPRDFVEFAGAADDIQDRDQGRELRAEWRRWQRKRFHVVPWNPLNNVLCHPDINTVFASHNRPQPGFLDRRPPVMMDRTFETSTVVHFPCDVERGFRQLGQITRSFAFPDYGRTQFIYALLKSAIRFTPEVFAAAARIVDHLGPFTYSSLHIRRNDFQYTESRAEPEVTAASVDALLEDGEPLYIATDETDDAFFADMPSARPVYRYRDVEALAAGTGGIKPKLIGCVEQLVCSAGRKFIGTPHSSFSTFISRLRGYIDAPDLSRYEHTRTVGGGQRDYGFIRRAVAGRAYMHEDHALWEDLDVDLPFYSVVCTDTRDYAHWQCELLEYSWKQVAQPGELLRLVARDANEETPRHLYARVIATAYTNRHPDTGDEYVPYNRLFSFREWLDSDPPPGTVLILDPDCVFRDRLPISVAPGAPVAQRWRGFALGSRWTDPIQRHSHVDPDRIQGVTWPALIHSRDLKSMISRWIDLTSRLRMDTGAWESDMMAFVVAAAEIGLTFNERHLTAVLNWPEDGARAPIIHYCQPVEARDGSELWFKQGYEPWQRTHADPADAKLDYCGDLIAILNEFVESKQIPQPHTVSRAHEVAALEAADPAKDYLLKIFLDSNRCIETKCERGDEVLHTLFSVLVENSGAGGTGSLLSVTATDGCEVHFHSSQIAALETIPVHGE